MSKPSFFREMLSVESSFSQYYEDKQGCPYSSDTLAIFLHLVSFVESCPFSNAKSSKFLCKNWRLTRMELRNLWQSETGVIKSDAVVRSQISNTSSLLYNMFPSFSAEVFLSENNTGLQKIALVLNSIDCYVTCPEDVFISEVCDYLNYRAYSKEFGVSECENELTLLSLLTKKNIFEKLDMLDHEKLTFILRSLVGRSSNLRNRSINEVKLEVLSRLSIISESISLESSTASKESIYTIDDGIEMPLEEGVSLAVNDSTPILSEPIENQYTLALSSELLSVLETRLNTGEIGVATDEGVSTATEFFSFYMKDRFEKVINSMSVADLLLALETFKKK